MLRNTVIYLEKIEDFLLYYYVHRQHSKSVAVLQVSFQGEIFQLPSEFLLPLASKEEADPEKPLEVIL